VNSIETGATLNHALTAGGKRLVAPILTVAIRVGECGMENGRVRKIANASIFSSTGTRTFQI
jgi:hypothetical protein